MQDYLSQQNKITTKTTTSGKNTEIAHQEKIMNQPIKYTLGEKRSPYILAPLSVVQSKYSLSTHMYAPLKENQELPLCSWNKFLTTKLFYWEKVYIYMCYAQ